jgi:hypothetical protein
LCFTSQEQHHVSIDRCLRHDGALAQVMGLVR